MWEEAHRQTIGWLFQNGIIEIGGVRGTGQ
jgi:hypothetical protein